MYLMKKPLQIVGVALCLGLSAQVYAQLRADVCRGQTKVLAQQQTEMGVDLEVEVTIEDCDGVCVGAIEYELLWVDADNTETLWHLTETWDWRDLDGAFTLSIHDDALPGAQLKEVKNVRIGRCSCSTRITP
jgi:hypothetical protein